MTERAKASKLTYLPVTSFVQNVASRSPTPGGGSVAALSGSLGAGLLTMCCRLSAARQGEEHLGFFRESEQKAIQLRDRLRELVDADSDAYGQVVQAMALPKDTEAEKKARSEAMDGAILAAAEVPLETVRVCLEGMELLLPVMEHCFPGAITDAGVAGLMLEAAFHGAAYNVMVNLPGVTDKAFVARAHGEIQSLTPKVTELARRIRRFMEEHLKG